jgi:hypothetical protein
MKYEPTTRLRFVERAVPEAVSVNGTPTIRVLQQYWAEEMPAYMRDNAKGEWRDVPTGVEAP